MKSTPEKDWIKNLVGENLLAVLDILLDVEKAIQFSHEVTIPLLPAIVKFPQLMPADGINFRDRYCDFRWKSTHLLQKRGVFKHVRLVEGLHRWEHELALEVNEVEFNSALKLAKEEYHSRTSRAPKADKSTKPSSEDSSIDKLKSLLLRFHSVAVQLRRRHNNRPTVEITDEYDVQDLLHALLCIYFDDIRPEEWTPSYAGKSSRVDFFLKPQGVVVEVKKTRPGLSAKEIGDQLIIDIARYAKMSGCKRLLCFVYDPENRIANPGGLEADLTGPRDGFDVEVLIVPRQY
jgi:hypothetical protein